MCPGHMCCWCLSPLLCLSLLLRPCHLLLGPDKLWQPGVRQPWMSIWHLICVSLSWQPWSNPSLGPPVSLDVDIKEGDTETWMATHLIWDTCSFLGQGTHASEQLSQCATTTEAKCHNYWSLNATESLFHNRRCHCHEKPAHFSWRVAPTLCN